MAGILGYTDSHHQHNPAHTTKTLHNQYNRVSMSITMVNDMVSTSHTTCTCKLTCLCVDTSPPLRELAIRLHLQECRHAHGEDELTPLPKTARTPGAPIAVGATLYATTS